MKLFRGTLIVLICLLTINIFAVAQQEEDTQEDTVDVVTCEEGGGCTQSESNLTQEEAETGVGDEAPEGNGDTEPYIVCAEGMGCMWTNLPPEEVDLAWGDDGEVPGVEENDQDEMIFSEDEVEDIIVTDEEALRLQEQLCGDEEQCGWTQLSPREINAMFNLNAEPIVPRSGTWLGESSDVEIVGCPASTEETGMLAGFANTETQEIEIGDSFETSDLIDVPGTTSRQPTANAYTLSMDLTDTASVRMVYLIVSEEQIIGHFFISVTAPNDMTCYGSAILNMTYTG